jgi:hypothetical protein
MGEDNPIRITIERDDKKAIFETSWDADINDLVELFKVIALWLTFDPSTIAEHLFTDDDLLSLSTTDDGKED